MDVLVLAGHADDETLGAGGLLQRLHGQGWMSRVIVLTNGYLTARGKGQSNRDACHAACELLGVTVQPTFLPFDDQKLDVVGVTSVASAVKEAIGDWRPSLIVTHAKTDLNKDHQIAFDVGCIVARRLPCTLLASEVPGYASWQGTAFQANFYVPLTGRQIARKVEAFGCYGNEQRPVGPTSALMSLAAVRGSEVERAYAEAFQLVRTVVAGVSNRLLV